MQVPPQADMERFIQAQLLDSGFLMKGVPANIPSLALLCGTQLVLISVPDLHGS